MKHIISLLLLAMVLFQGCDNRREIFDDNRVEVIVNLDWVNLTKMPRGSPPNGATVVFFPRSGSGMLTKPVFILTNYAQAKLSLPIGVYDILVFNETVDGYSYITFTGTDKYETFEAYWDTSKLKEEYTRGGSKSAVLNSDDMLLVERMEGFEITPSMTINNTSLSLDFTPKVVNIPMKVVVKVKGLDNVSRSGSMLYVEGMASGYNLSQGKPAGKSVTHLMPFTEKIYNEGSIKDGVMSASFYVFGLSKDITRALTDNILRCVIKLRDGTTLPDIVRDISSSIKEEVIDGSIELEVEVGIGSKDPEEGKPEDEEIIIPEVPDTEDPNAGSGFDGTVNDWDDEVVTDIPI